VDRQTLPVLTSLAEVNQFQHFRRLTRTLVFVETELSDWIRTTEQWTKSSPPSHVDILYIMEWVRYELPEESLREFVEVARGLTVGEYVYTPQKAKAE
jgi:hypothetical protein